MLISLFKRISHMDLIVFLSVFAAHVAGSIYLERWVENYFNGNLLRPTPQKAQAFYHVFEFPANCLDYYAPWGILIDMKGCELRGKPLTLWVLFDLPWDADVFAGLNGIVWGTAAALLARLCTLCISRFRKKNARGFEVLSGVEE